MKKHGQEMLCPHSRQHITNPPTVAFYKQKEGAIDDISEGDRIVNGEQSSRELLRTGCVQRYVRDGEEE